MSASGPNELTTNVDTPVKYSNRVLSQTEGCAINFYTINFARFACADVKVSPEGQRVFNGSLLNVPRWASLDDRLQFGFGEKHLLRNAGVQLFEYEHLILGAALGEFFSEAYAAAIFSALADFFEDDDRPKPRQESFKRFTHSANGLLSFTQFPLVVDDRIRLNPYRDHDRGMPHAITTTEFIPLDRIALALRMLGKLRNGEIQELTLVGGDVVGWFSAFIELFLGISQTLLDKDGNTLYSSNGKTLNVELIYTPLESAIDPDKPNTILLRKQINLSKRSDALPHIMTGRVVGESLFSKVFGRAFHILDQTETRAFGNALGGLARSWECWVKDENTPPTFSQLFPGQASHDPGSWGTGLVETWTNWFPELRHLQGRMERALKGDRKAAGKLCEDSIVRLEPLCGCYICSKTEGSDEHPTNLPKHDFCIPTMMETIIILGLTLSRVTLPPDLYPSRAGILAMYKTQVHRRIETKRTEAKGFERMRILFGDNWNSTIPERLQNAVTLFSGSRPTADIPDNLTAISHEGMCAYVLKLQRGDQVQPRTDDDLIRVTMGHINWRQKIYARLCVGCVQPPVEISEGWESFKCEHFKERIYVK